MSNKKGLIAGIVAGALVLGGGVTAFAIANHNKVKVEDVSVEETVTDLDAENAGGLGDVSSMTDAATATEAESVDEDANLTPLMASLKGLVAENGVAETGLFEGHTVNATTYWEHVDFGYTSTGVLEAEILEQDPSMMLVYYIGSDSKINVALYKDNGGEVTEVANMPLSYTGIYESHTDFLVSNDIVNFFGTEGLMSAKTVVKDGVTYILTLNNSWFISSEIYNSGSERGYTPETSNFSQLAIYKVNPDGIEGCYQVRYSAYGMDGAGQIFVTDFADNILEEYHYGDLGDDPHTLENFMGEYDQAMANIGFPELTNTDNFTLTHEGCLGDGVSWNLHWDCNTNLAEGDDVVTLELTENSNVEENWRDWKVEEPVAEEAPAEAPTAGVVDTPSQSFEEADARYAAFFANEYAELDDSLYLSSNGVAVKYAFADLDKDGLDEMLIGDDQGVYAIVSETDGTYNVSEVCGWMIQYGAVSGEYLGSGCFKNDASNGNNYGGEFRIDVVWKYSGNLHACGVLARLSASWDPNNIGENLNNWELYVANDENNIVGDDYADAGSLTPDNLDYTYKYIDYGNNYNFTDDGELETNDLIDTFNSVVDSRKADGAMSALDWHDVPQ